MVMCGLFAGLTAICSFITIPLGFTPIPVNLATLAVFLAGGILGKKYGTLSILVYILIGAAGLPVFAGFRGGPGDAVKIAVAVLLTERLRPFMHRLLSS